MIHIKPFSVETFKMWNASIFQVWVSQQKLPAIFTANVKDATVDLQKGFLIYIKLFFERAIHSLWCRKMLLRAYHISVLLNQEINHRVEGKTKEKTQVWRPLQSSFFGQNLSLQIRKFEVIDAIKVIIGLFCIKNWLLLFLFGHLNIHFWMCNA